MRTHDWERHWYRVLRYLDRAEEAEKRDRDFASQVDAWIDVFVHTWHLRDHIKNDSALRMDVRVGSEVLRKGPLVHLCGEIANGERHLIPYRDTEPLEGVVEPSPVFEELDWLGAREPTEPVALMALAFGAAIQPTAVAQPTYACVTHTSGRTERARHVAKGAIAECVSVLTGLGLFAA